VFVERGEIDTLGGAFVVVVVDATGVRTHIPVGGVACIMPGLDSRRPFSPRERR
jgi:CRISPR-associated protein Cas1